MNAQKLHRWLHDQTNEWTRSGLVTGDQARAIRDRYPTASAGPAWGTVVFSSLGAAIVGLGIILLFAYNWAAIPRLGKIALVLGVLAATHVVGVLLAWGPPRNRKIGAGVSLLGTMLFGAGIWVVAQVYHIDEHFPNGFLVWSVGALAMALSLPSVPHGMLAAVLLSVWAGAERVGFNAPMSVAPILIGATLGLLAYRLRSLALLAVVLLAFLVAYLFAAPRFTDTWPYATALLGFASLYVALSRLARRHGSFPSSSPLLAFYGWSVGLIVLFALSFPAIADDVLRASHDRLGGRLYVWWFLPVAVSTLAWLLVLWSGARARRGTRPGEPLGLDDYLLPLSALLAAADGLYLRDAAGWVVAAPFALALLALAASLIAHGCRHGALRPTVLGSLLLIALAFARYFDLFESLLARGFVFILLGATLFGQGIIYSRARKRRQEAPPP